MGFLDSVQSTLNRGVAATKAWNVLYAPMRPKDGLRFSAGDCLAFPRGMGECTLDLNEGQHYSPSLVQPRVPLIYAVSRAEPRKERLRVIRNADGTLSVVNGLSGNLSALALVDADGRLHVSGAPVAAGARAELEQAGRVPETLDETSIAQKRSLCMDLARILKWGSSSCE